MPEDNTSSARPAQEHFFPAIHRVGTPRADSVTGDLEAFEAFARGGAK
jgi:hypothetical protein